MIFHFVRRVSSIIDLISLLEGTKGYVLCMKGLVSCWFVWISIEDAAVRGVCFFSAIEPPSEFDESVS